MSEELTKLLAEIMGVEAEAFRISNHQKILNTQYNTTVNKLNILYGKRDTLSKQGVIERAKAVALEEEINTPKEAIPEVKAAPKVKAKIVPQKRDSLEQP